MNRQSSYSAPRSQRNGGGSSPSGGTLPQGHRTRGRKSGSSGKKPDWMNNRVVFALLYIILPFIAVNLVIFVLATSSPGINVTIGDTDDYKSVDISFRINSILPLRSVNVTLEGEELEMEKDGRTYSAQITRNGVLEINVVSLNGLRRNSFTTIAVLDDAAPMADEDYILDEDSLTITLQDTQSGVDYDSIYGMDEEGEEVLPSLIDEDTGKVVFPMDTDRLVVYVQDLAGNGTQLTYGLESANSSSDEDPEDEKADLEEEDEEEEETSKARETTKAQTSAARETTKAQTSAARETTKAQTSAARETTKAQTSAARETTKAQTSAARETTKAQTSAAQTTAAPTTTAQTTAAPTTAAAASSPASPDEQTSDDSITIVPLN